MTANEIISIADAILRRHGFTADDRTMRDARVAPQWWRGELRLTLSIDSVAGRLSAVSWGGGRCVAGSDDRHPETLLLAALARIVS